MLHVVRDSACLASPFETVPVGLFHVGCTWRALE